MIPTAEQAKAVELFSTGGSLAIEAGAGSGKTSTLVLLAESAGRRRGQYVAFNKALVTDSAGKFPLTVACNTAHSLAFRAVGKNYSQRLSNTQRIPSYQLARLLNIDGMGVSNFEGKPRQLSAGFLATNVMRAITNYCQTAEPELTLRHFPYIEGLDAPEPGTGKRTYATNTEVAIRLLPVAQRVWDDLHMPYGVAPFKHEHYLKMWQLDDPRIDADYILFDEAQDANPVIASIVANQRHAQLVYVGDSQQEIYGWTGAVNALGQVEVANRSFLTQSFRFGQAIADQANRVLDELGAELRLTGNPAIESRVDWLGNPRAILTRTNAAGIERLLKLQEGGRRAHFLGGSTDVLGFARASDELSNAGHTNYPDLACFDSWQAVIEYVDNQDEEGDDLRLLVRLVTNFGSQAIITGLSQMPPEDRADVVISTAHKSKGRQWDTVQIASDFRRSQKPDQERKETSKAELRLLYVALTRAQRVLDIDAIKPATEAAESPEQEN